MAGVFGDINSGAISLSVDTEKTAIQLTAPTNQRGRLCELAITFSGIAATDTPVLARILRQTTAGTMTTGTVGTHQSKHNKSDDETLQMGVFVNATAEPTAGDVLRRIRLHPQFGGMVKFDPPIDIPGGTRLGVALTAHEAQTAEVTGIYEE